MGSSFNFTCKSFKWYIYESKLNSELFEVPEYKESKSSVFVSFKTIRCQSKPTKTVFDIFA